VLDIEAVEESLSSRVFAEWMAYASIEPFGEERADLRSGIIACTIAEPNRDKKKHPEPFSPREFMPRFSSDEPPATSAPTPDQLSEMVLRMFPKPKKKGRL
jgi:hypothetical protein